MKRCRQGVNLTADLVGKLRTATTRNMCYQDTRWLYCNIRPEELRGPTNSSCDHRSTKNLDVYDRKNGRTRSCSIYMACTFMVRYIQSILGEFM